MGGVGVWELIVILILVFIIFGGRRIPELGRGLGQGLANFRQAVKGRGSASDPKPGSDNKPDPSDEKER